MFALKELLQLYTDLSRNFTLDFAEKIMCFKASAFVSWESQS